MTPRERASWCVNVARVANMETHRMAPASAKAWIVHLGQFGECDWHRAFSAYMRSIQPEGWWMVPIDNRWKPALRGEHGHKPALCWVWA